MPQFGTWISTEDRLPKLKENVLMYLDYHCGCYSVREDALNVDVYGYYLAGADWIVLGEDCDFLYWMPLPEPPKEDKSE